MFRGGRPGKGGGLRVYATRVTRLRFHLLSVHFVLLHGRQWGKTRCTRETRSTSTCVAMQDCKLLGRTYPSGTTGFCGAIFLSTSRLCPSRVEQHV
jgi:hypothetical protein